MADKPFFQSLFEPESNEAKFSLPPIEEAPKQDLPKADARQPAKTERWLPPSELRPIFDAAAKEFDVPVNVLMALGHQESRYNPSAIGQPTQWGRAKGLMQYLDDTAKGLGINPLDPAEAIPAAARQLKERLAKGYSMEDAIKEHFAGPDRKLWGKKTASYGREVMEKVGRIGELMGFDTLAQAAQPEVGAPQTQDTAGLIELTAAQAARIEAGEAADTVLGLVKPQETGANQEERGFFDRAGEGLARGYDNMVQSLDTARFAMGGGDSDTLAKALEKKFADEQARKKTPGEQEIDQAFQRVTDAKGAWETTKEGFKAVGTAIANPKDLAVGIAEQMPNMLPTLGAGAAGAGGGAAIGAGVGAAVGGIGAVPGAVGGAVWGGRAGMVAGTTATELGAEIEYMLLKKLEEQKAAPTAQNIKALLDDQQFRSDARNQGLAKGLTVGVIDQVFLGLGGKVAGKAATAGTIGRKAAIGTGAVALDAAGETVGEAASQKVARGEVDAGDALREGVYGLGQSVVEPVIGAGMQAAKAGAQAAGQGAQSDQSAATPQAAAAPATPQPPPSTVTVTPAQPTASGPMGRAQEAASAQASETPPRATVTAPEGTITGFVQDYKDNGQGGFTARILGDDGQVYQFTEADGVQVAIEQPQASGPMTNSMEKAAAEASAVTEQAATNSDIVIPASEQNQGVTEQSAPAEAAEQATSETQAAPVESVPPAKIEPPALDAMTDEQLSERLQYIAGQAKVSGMDRRLSTERRRVEREINKRKAAAPATPDVAVIDSGKTEFATQADANAAMLAAADRTDQPHEVVEQGGKFIVQPIQETSDAAVNDGGRSAGIAVRSEPADAKRADDDGYSAGERPAAAAESGPQSGTAAVVASSAADGQPALNQKRAKALKRIEKGTAFFGTPEKTQTFIDEHGIGDTHEVKQTGAKRFEVAAKAAADVEPAVNTTVTDRDEPKGETSEAADDPLRTAIDSAYKDGNGGKELPVGLRKTADAMHRAIIDRDAKKLGEILHPDNKVSRRAFESLIRGQLLPKTVRGTQELVDDFIGKIGEKLNGQPNAKTHDAAPEAPPAIPADNAPAAELVRDDADVGESAAAGENKAGSKRPVKTGDALADYWANSAGESVRNTPPKVVDLTKAEPTVTANKVFTEDAAAKARALLKSKLSQLNSGIDPEMMQAGIVLAGYHIEKGARTFSAYASAMIEDLGDAVKPYLKSWYMAVSFDPRAADFDGMTPVSEVEKADISTAGKQQITTGEPVASGNMIDALYQAITDGNLPADNNALRKFVSDFDGQSADNARLKAAQEALEAALARRARDIVGQGGSIRDTFERLVKLYSEQPNLNIRTSTSIENQAYSTPAPLAYLASKLTGITKRTSVYEPTAGNGMLLITADPANATANELEDTRFANLQALGFDAIQGDALEAITSGVVVEKSQDAVITNPPFGSVKDAAGKATKVAVDGYKIGKIDHLIAAEALKAMKDDGKATLILGADKVAGGISTDDRIFMNWLYSNYNVTSHFEVDGKLYARQGASWPVRVITVNGRAKSAMVSPKPGTIARVGTWEEVYGQYEQGVVAQVADDKRAARGADGAVQQPVADDTEPAAQPAGTQVRADAGGQPKPGTAGNGNVAGERAGTVRAGTKQPAEPVAGASGQERGDGTPARPDRLAQGNREDRPSGAEAGADQPRRDTGAARVENAFQAAYVPRSARQDDGVLIPVNMAQPTQDALNRLEDAVGDIDAYVMRELGYASKKELHDALMGLQVDSVASAIHQISQGKGVIIADQTGIGKGRQAAAVIRWAKNKGNIPVFVTVKPQLFTDMYGDLADIGTEDVAPLILNADEAITSAAGDKLFGNQKSRHKQTMQEIAATGTLPDGRNALFMTYSQINTPNLQRQVVAALAPRAVFVLDESHNAGGQSATGEFIRETLGLAQGVTYLSATYAKRPDNMPVYFKTDIGEAIGDDGALMAAMEAGGLPLQTVVSNNLVKAGQMFRRERSYDGVSIKTIIDTERTQEHEALSDSVTGSLRAIVDADRAFHNGFVAQLADELAGQGQALQDIAGNQASEGVNHTEFSSVVHNFVRQLLLGLKADAAADEAIDAIKRGEKPLIAVENTMGSFLSEYADHNGLKVGSTLGAFDYRTVLSRALERTRYVVRQLPNGDKVKEKIELAQLDPETRASYDAAQATIDALDLDIPVSPIDWMRYRLEQAGYSVAEITGRNLTVDYAAKKPKLAQLSADEQKDKVATTRKFNDGRLDALILNVAGSTGISLHASERFKDQRPRHMIVAQAAQDINIFMQMLGRIHRTGQVKLPSYAILNVDLPAEKRPTALLSKKMKSLNANTSSNTESATSIQSADMLNKYGDQVIGQYLFDNPDLSDALGIDEPMAEGGPMEDVARKATGRLALMPVAVQKAFYAEVEEQYTALIDYLNKTNQNELEPRTYDYDARETRAQVIFEGEKPETPFGQDAVYTEFSIKAQGKPMTPDEIRAEAQENSAGQTGKEHAAAMVARLDGGFADFTSALTTDTQKAEAERVKGTASDFIRTHAIGSAWRVEINGELYNGVVTNIRSTHKGTGNPFSMSKIQVALALNGSLRHVSVPASQFRQIEVAPVRGERLEDLFREGAQDEREVAKVVTGNLLAAYGEISGAKGTIINFTKADGTTEQGILLPKKFNLKANTRGDYRLKTAAAALKFVQESEDQNMARFGISNREGTVRVTPQGRGIEIAVPKSKARGGKFFLDKTLTAITGDFVSSGAHMKVGVPASKAEAALAVIMDKNALYAVASMAEEARQIVGDVREAAPQDAVDDAPRYSVRADLDFRDVWPDDDNRPVYYGRDFTLQPLRAFDTASDFEENGLPLGQSAFVEDGNQVIEYQINAPGTGQHLGSAALQVDKSGAVVAIHDIVVNLKSRGLGTSIVAAILANARGPVKVIQMVPSAQPFWESVGVYGQDQYDNGILDFAAFQKSPRGRTRAVAGESVQGATSAGAGRDQGTGTGTRYSVAPQTDSAAFKRWFGNSKAADADGKPLAVYHGTRFDFSEFDGYEVTGWFSSDANLSADRYAFGDSDDAGPNVMPVYLSLQNPKVIDGDMDDVGDDGAPLFEQINNSAYVKQLIDDGHDGIIVNENGVKTFAAFRPEQIKSVFNSGDFDPANPDIRYSVNASGQTEAEFGPVHTAYRNDPKAAIARLMADKTGEAIVAHPQLGDISLVYGDGKFGLSHIAERRGADFLSRLPRLFENGTLYSKDNQSARLFLGTDKKEATIRLDWNGKAKAWLVSAYEKYPDLTAAGEVAQSRRADTVEARTARPMNQADLRQALTKGALGSVIARLIEHGTITLHASSKTLPKEAGKNVRGIQAVTLPGGQIHMVAASVYPDNARAVLLHEMFHKGAQKLIGSEQWSKLQGRGASLYRQSEQSSGRAREVFDRARERVATAKKQNAVSTRMEVEEFLAYAIEEYERAPQSLPAALRKWVEDVIGLVKAWLVKAYGKQLGQVTPAQLAAFAKLALMDVAIERRGELFGPIGTLFSVADTELRLNLPLSAQSENVRRLLRGEIKRLRAEAWNAANNTLDPDTEDQRITGKQLVEIITDRLDSKDDALMYLSALGVQVEGMPVEARYSVAPDTESAEFKKWFGKSKVVDDNGMPRVVYHGTDRNFTSFDIREFGATDEGMNGKGFYFAANEAATDPYGEYVMPVYLSLQNPYIHESYASLGDEIGMASDKITQRLIADGYDGVIAKDENGVVYEYVAFRADQIKSAADNNGQFDPKNPDIRYSVAPEAADKVLADAQAALAAPNAKDDFIGSVVGDMSLPAKLILHPRQVASVHPKFTPVYLTGVSQMETRDENVAELGVGMAAYDNLPQASKVNVNKVLELGRLMSQVFTDAELSSGVANTGQRTIVVLDDKGKPKTSKVPVKALLTEAGEVMALTQDEIKAYRDLRTMFDQALDKMRDQTLIDMGFGAFVQPLDGKRPLIIEDAGDGKIVLKGTVYTDEEKAIFRTGDKEKIAEVMKTNPVVAIIKKFDGAKWNPGLFGYEFDANQRNALEKELDTYLKQSIAKQIIDLIDDTTPEKTAERMRNVARFINEIEQTKRTGYVPFARYGDYVVTVKEKIADPRFLDDGDDRLIVMGLPDSFSPDMLELGAVALTKAEAKKEGGAGWRIAKHQKKDVEKLAEKTVYSAKVETGLRDLPVTRRDHKVDEIKGVKDAIAKAQKEWVDGNPNRRIVSFKSREKIAEAGVNLTDVSALAEISTIDDATWQAVHEKLLDAQKAKGFRRHLIHADNVPGYTGDFERAMADYVIGMSGYLSRRQHMKRWDSAIDRIADQPRLRKYAEDYRAYMNNPQEELAFVRQVGFLSYIAGVMMSAFANLTQVPLLTVPTLAQVAPMPLVLKETARAYKDAIAMLTKKSGLDFFDPAKAPADVRSALEKAWAEGAFIPLETLDLMMTARQKDAGRRRGVKLFNDATKVISSAFTFAERTNRLVTFIAAARLADKPAIQKNAKRVLKGDALARREVLNNWTQQSFAEWVVDESQYRMGKANRPTVMRGVGSAIMQFKGFMLQTFEAWYRMAALHGKEGKYAMASSIVGMAAFAGLWGLPGADDLRELLEAIYKQITDRDLDMKTELRQWTTQVSGSNFIGTLVNKGVPYASLGIDMTRIGMGSIVPDSPLAAAGIPFDMLLGRPKRSFEKASAGDYFGAAGEMTPNFVKHPLVAAGWATDGVRDKQGNRILRPEDLSKWDIFLKGLGSQPAIITDVRDYEYAQRRQETAVDGLKRSLTNKIAKTIAEMERTTDPEKIKDLDARLDELWGEVAEHNADAAPEEQITIGRQALKNRILRELGGVQSTWGKERKAARGAADELRGVFGLEQEGDE